MANTYLSRTPSGAGNRKTFTLSTWFKTAGGTGGEHIFQAYSAGSDYMAIIMSGNTLIVKEEASSSAAYFIQTNRKFRDVNAWYHLTVAYNSTESTAADRIKIYINGVQETSFSSAAYPSQNLDSIVNSTVIHTIGASGTGAEFWNGSMSHFHFVDATAYPASTFGSTDSTTGEWKINTSPSITMGTNGFTILKDGNTITDQSANSNNFTLAGGTLTNTEDCPSNVFCTFNPLFPQVNTGTSKGNTRFETTSGSGWRTMCGTLGMEKNTGKYYMEFKHLGGTNNGYGIADYTDGGVVEKINRSISTYAGNNANSYGYLSQGEFFYNGSYTASGWNSYTTNDIIGMAVDMENMKLYFHKNGTYENSGNPTAGTGGYTIADPVGAYLPVVSVNSAILCANFGNGYFETTAVSSAGTNASGIGIFEYDVPTGYTALSTKGLNL